MLLKCNKPIDGYTVGKTYELLGCAGEHIEVVADDGKKYVVFEGYFDIVNE